MDTPEQFLEACDQFVERSAWTEKAMLRGSFDVAQMKSYIAEGRAFFARWQKFLQKPNAIEETRTSLAEYDELEAFLDKLWRKALREALEERELEIRGVTFHKITVAALKVSRTSPHLREECESLLRDDASGPFDPEKAYRESEADLNAAEELSRLALAKLEVDWPEKIDDAVRQRWQELPDIAAVQAWQQETLEKSA